MIERYTRDVMGRLFTDEARLSRWLEVELALEKHKAIAKPDLEEIMTADKWARETVLKELS